MSVFALAPTTECRRNTICAWPGCTAGIAALSGFAANATDASANQAMNETARSFVFTSAPGFLLAVSGPEHMSGTAYTYQP
jgi:hypothetical protein